ncbi:MAG: HlyD family efflux transporter periplasmic adaptor subunit [Rubrivivax sp.]|nr:MAG: HlyD family efflux transporter periplasmic adaptor subunit [Rubrivivax sp.]
MSLQNLFRKEAVEHRGQRLLGEVLLHVPAGARWVTLLVVLAFALLIGFLALGTYARKETVGGWLRPERGVIRVEAQSDGVVDSLHAAEGDLVARGAAIAALRLDGQLDRGQTLSSRLLGDLGRERAQMEQQQEALRARFVAREARLKDQVQSFEAEIAQFRRQLETLDRRAELAQRQVSDQADLARQGYLSRRDADRLEDAALAVVATRESVRQDMLERDTALRNTRLELAGIGHERDAALAELGEKLASLDQRSTEATRRGQVMLVAPIAARVANVRVETGAAVKAGTLVADLLPADSALRAELFAPSRAIGFVKPGDEVRLRYDAFPYQKFGVGRGRVISVSRAAVDARELPMGISAQGPVYRVMVSLDQGLPGLEGTATALRAGMTLQADLVLEERRVVEYLFSPVLGLARNH